MCGVPARPVEHDPEHELVPVEDGTDGDGSEPDIDPEPEDDPQRDEEDDVVWSDDEPTRSHDDDAAWQYERARYCAKMATWWSMTYGIATES